MDDVFKLVCSLTALVLIVSFSVNLINNFQADYQIRVFAGQVNDLINVMSSLSDLRASGSWRLMSLNVPDNYSVLFNNLTDNIEFHGVDGFNVSLPFDIVYSVELINGSHKVQVYYGLLDYGQVKELMVVFK